MNEELYKQYEADKLLVNADPTLTAQQRADVLTQLTDDLLAAEEARGIRWQLLASVEVQATQDGTARIGDA